MVAVFKPNKYQKEVLQNEVFSLFDKGLTINEVSKQFKNLKQFYQDDAKRLEIVKNWYTKYKKQGGKAKRDAKNTKQKNSSTTLNSKRKQQVKKTVKKNVEVIPLLEKQEKQPLEENTNQVTKFVAIASQIQGDFQFAPLNEVMHELIQTVKISAEERKHYQRNILPVKKELYTKAFKFMWEAIAKQIDSGYCKFDQNFISTLLSALKLGEDLAKSYQSPNLTKVINSLSQTLQVEQQAIKSGYVKDVKEESNNIEADIAQIQDIND